MFPDLADVIRRADFEERSSIRADRGRYHPCVMTFETGNVYAVERA
jgi:hypothetical protein